MTRRASSVVLALALGYACQMEDPRAGLTDPPPPTLHGPKMEIVENGVLAGELTADSAQASLDSAVVWYFGATAIYHDRNGREVGTLTADRIRLGPEGSLTVFGERSTVGAIPEGIVARAPR